MIDTNDLRIISWCEKLIVKYDLNLSGLKVLTELATGNYFYVPILATLAKGQVFTVDKNHILGVNDKISRRLKEYGIHVVWDKYYAIKECDIICNSGNLRPIDKEDIEMMRPAAVVSLMMAPDQIRAEDIDIKECRKRKIVLIGPDEQSMGIWYSIPFKVLKVLFEAGMSVWSDRYLFVGRGKINEYVYATLDDMGVDVWDRYTKQYPIGHTGKTHLSEFDAMIILDYTGRKIDFDIQRIKKENPLLKVINISGNVDVQELLAAGIDVSPTYQAAPGHTTVSGDYLSYKVTLELACASLKVAEVAARVRLEGKSVNEAESAAVRQGGMRLIRGKKEK